VVEVFKTTVQEVVDAEKIIALLLTHLPAHKINFDLDDCDKILRVEGESVKIELICELLQTECFDCEVL